MFEIEIEIAIAIETPTVNRIGGQAEAPGATYYSPPPRRLDCEPSSFAYFLLHLNYSPC